MSEVATPCRPRAGSDHCSNVVRQVSGAERLAAPPTRSERGYLIAALSGRLDITSSAAVREQLLTLLSRVATRLVLDLSMVTHIDASGLAVLVGTERRSLLLGGSMRLAGPRPAVVTAVRVAGLDRRLKIFPTVQSAVSSPAGAMSQSARDVQPA